MDFLRSEHAFGYACLRLLGPGFVGLLVACVLAANMSTCSNFMVNTGALFTRNFYGQYLRPFAADREILLVGRLSGLGLTLLGVLFALCVDQVLDAFLFTETIAALMGIMFIGGFLWKRANRAGAWGATITAFAVYYALNFLLTCQGPEGPFKTLTAACSHLWNCGDPWGFLATGKLKLVYKWAAAPYGWATLIGFANLIALSLLTRPEAPERMKAFFDKQRHSSDTDGLPPGAPAPLAADRGQDLLFLDLPGWFDPDRRRNFWRRYREDLVGFALAWCSVGLLVLIAWVVVRIGA